MAKTRFTRNNRFRQITEFTMRFALKHQNLHLGDESVLSVSHPDSPFFGQHWTLEKIVETRAIGEDLAVFRS
ncbi:hypothetical protein VTN77DRAFT_1021 [Rasamsonia byssochlamydoides]|uniref:uncharacterized protein n=1 Tax=Rasamsonia byssochlamydoides TaxID=89139 RepID=UPI0037428A39